MAVIDPIDPFASDVDVTSTDTTMQDLASKLGNYDQNFSKYKERLAPYSYQAPNMSIYDLASELGAGLLSTPNTGGASAFTGLGVGFTNASQRMKKNQEENAKARQEVQLQAAQLAMQDEQKADEFLNAYALKTIGDTNKEIKTMNLSWVDKDTNERKQGTLNKASPLFKEIMSDPETYQAQEVTQPLVDMSNSGDQYSKLNENTADSITSMEEEWGKEAIAQVGILDKTQSARYYANQLDDDNFGPLAVFNMGVDSILVQLGFDGLVDKEKLGASFAVNSVGTGLAMGLIGQTKGAISDREMKMFLKASATLGNSKTGFLNILDITDKIANRSIELNSLWAQERAKLMEDGVSLSQIKAKQASFKADYHKKNPMFPGSAEYNPDLSIEENLANMEEGTEAYALVQQMTEEGGEVYKNISQKHATFGNPDEKPKATANNIAGVPNGSIEAGVYKSTDPNDPNNGKTLYRSADGQLHVAD